MFGKKMSFNKNETAVIRELVNQEKQKTMQRQTEAIRFAAGNFESANRPFNERIKLLDGIIAKLDGNG